MFVPRIVVRQRSVSFVDGVNVHEKGPDNSSDVLVDEAVLLLGKSSKIFYIYVFVVKFGHDF